MNRLDVIATYAHYLDHIAPIWHALPGDARGTFWVAPGLVNYAAQKGITATPIPKRPREMRTPTLTLTAAYRDLKRAYRAGRPAVYMQHGNGQTFIGRKHPAYLGTTHNELVRLYLAPAERCVTHMQTTAPISVVGCPKLDQWHPPAPKPRDTPPTVAIAWHWDAQWLPETRSAYYHYRPALRMLKDMEEAGEIRLLGHSHPLIIQEIIPEYEALGIEYTRSFEEVMRRADLYVNDASSTLYEFASLDRPVVVMNCPLYRKDVEHGLRFWSNADVGIQVEGPRDLPDAIRLALSDPPEQQANRQRGVQAAYAYTDGRCAARAAEAILSIL